MSDEVKRDEVKAASNGGGVFREFLADSEEDVVKIFFASKRREDVHMAMVFKPLLEPELRQYRSIFSGRVGKKGSPKAAIEFLFKSQFLRSENCKLPENQFADEKEFFMRDPKGRLMMDSAINEYIGKETTEADDIKE